MLQVLSLCARLDELLVRVSFLLTGCLAQFPLVVDLVGQIHAQKLLLLLLCLHIALNLIERFFWAEMWLVVKFFNGFLSVCHSLLLNDLVPDKVNMILILLLLTVSLSTVHLVHVVHGGVELIFLKFSLSLDPLDLLVEPADGLLVHASNLVVGVRSLVRRVVVNCEWTL